MNDIGIILILLILSAFFSGCEMAFLSINKLLLELNRSKHPILFKILNLFVSHPGTFITTMLIGNNIVLVLYGLLMGQLLEPAIRQFVDSQSAILLVQTLISTLIILVTGEFLPKTLFRIQPIGILNALAMPLVVIYTLFYPVSRLTMGVSNLMLKYIFKSPGTTVPTTPVIGRIDLDHLLSEHEEKQVNQQHEVADEVKFLRNALDLSSTKIRECTIPRTQIEAIEVHDTIDELKQLFIKTGHSKVLVYKDTIDNIIGYVHVSELFKHPKSVRNMLYPISVVPETMTASKVLEIFTRDHKSIALVVDEFGGTSGIVTMEDILEEIFGEIDDEHDVNDLVMTRVNDDEFLLSGRVEVDTANEQLELELPVSDDYETVAGLILYHHESIPAKNEIIEFDTFTVTIEEASNNRIDLVRIRLHD
ncbi:MAG: HlyC/CorC family transporter [Marinilabiliaceae bacterium]|nr:HlyC/CorC family transporter [Marinilabiliaceae bacterium]